MKIYTPATDRLKELYLKYHKVDYDMKDATFFDSDNFSWNNGGSYYKTHNYTLVSEQEFINAVCPELDTSKGYKEQSSKLNYELDFEFITQMSERMSTNKGKYDPYNWKKPINVEELKQALFRHVIEVMKGNYEDDGRLQGHLEAISCNAMMINYQVKNNDEPKKSS